MLVLKTVWTCQSSGHLLHFTPRDPRLLTLTSERAGRDISPSTALNMVTDISDRPASRSPSPPAAPPLASAPGPRASALLKLHSDAIAHILKTCNYANFSACFPTPAKEVPGSMKALHAQFTEKLGEQLHGNFDELVRERGVVGRLNELDALVEEAKRRKEAQPGEVPSP
jgi:hypothetical protein